MINLCKHCFKYSYLALCLIVVACSGGQNIKQAAQDAAQTSQETEASVSVRESFAEAQRLLDRNDYQAAIDILEQINTQNDQLAGVHANLGIAYGQLAQYDAAKQALQTAVALNSEDSQILNAMALAYRNSGEFVLAKETYMQNVDLNPDNARTHFNLGILCDIYMNDLPCAIENYKAYEAIYKRAVDSAEAAAVAQAAYEAALADKANKIATAIENGEPSETIEALEAIEIAEPTIEIIPLPDDPKNEQVVFWIEDLERRTQRE